MTLHGAGQRPKANYFPVLKNFVGLKITMATMQRLCGDSSSDLL
jgi:hypothetical protein